MPIADSRRLKQNKVVCPIIDTMWTWSPHTPAHMVLTADNTSTRRRSGCVPMEDHNHHHQVMDELDRELQSEISNMQGTPNTGKRSSSSRSNASFPMFFNSLSKPQAGQLSATHTPNHATVPSHNQVDRPLAQRKLSLPTSSINVESVPSSPFSNDQNQEQEHSSKPQHLPLTGMLVSPTTQEDEKTSNLIPSTIVEQPESNDRDLQATDTLMSHIPSRDDVAEKEILGSRDLPLKQMRQTKVVCRSKSHNVRLSCGYGPSHCAPPVPLRDLREAFNFMDTDHSGYVSEKELYFVLRAARCTGVGFFPQDVDMSFNDFTAVFSEICRLQPLLNVLGRLIDFVREQIAQEQEEWLSCP